MLFHQNTAATLTHTWKSALKDGVEGLLKQLKSFSFVVDQQRRVCSGNISAIWARRFSERC